MSASVTVKLLSITSCSFSVVTSRAGIVSAHSARTCVGVSSERSLLYTTAGAMSRRSGPSTAACIAPVEPNNRRGFRRAARSLQQLHHTQVRSDVPRLRWLV
jgi:hypothetical protein